jgi:hypothetical protein
VGSVVGMLVSEVDNKKMKGNKREQQRVIICSLKIHVNNGNYSSLLVMFESIVVIKLIKKDRREKNM